jgi:Condensation domain
MNNLNRKLGLVENLFETCHQLGAIIDVNVARIEGIINDETLRQALDLVQKRHPLLQVGIVESEGGFSFLSNQSLKIPLYLIDRQQDNQWVCIVEEEIHTKFPNNSCPLCRVKYIRSKSSSESEIIVTFHHAITDGISCMYFIHELLSYCQQILTGVLVPEVTSMPMLPPIENLINAELWQKSDLDTNIKKIEEKSELIIEREAPTSQRRTRLIHKILSQDIASILQKRCQQEGTTVHGALCAAALLSMYKLNDADKPINLSCGSGVNLRKYCVPEISNSYIGCFISEVQTNHRLDKNVNFWDLARECKSKINDSIKSGVPFKNISSGRINMVNHDFIVKMSEYNMGRNKSVYVSNLGSLNLFEHNNINQIRELYFVTGQHVIGACFWMGVVSLYEQIFCSFAHVVPLISVKTAEVIADSVSNIIQKACMQVE